MKTPLCDGHFPGHPLVPGALLLHWMQLAVDALGGDRPTRVERLRFAREVCPGEHIRIVATQEAQGVAARLFIEAGEAARCRFVGP